MIKPSNYVFQFIFYDQNTLNKKIGILCAIIINYISNIFKTTFPSVIQKKYTIAAML